MVRRSVCVKQLGVRSIDVVKRRTFCSGEVILLNIVMVAIWHYVFTKIHKILQNNELKLCIQIKDNYLGTQVYPWMKCKMWQNNLTLEQM